MASNQIVHATKLLMEEENADVGFAVILLTADDKGYDKTKPDEIADRARQNVILEMGYFIGRKGRDRLMVICDSSVERPGDISGVVYLAIRAIRQNISDNSFGIRLVGGMKHVVTDRMIGSQRR